MGQVDVSIRIAESDRSSIADALSQLLADSYTLYLKTHNYHWNVTGPHFGALHAIFETQYTDQALAVDAVAERIRALGHRAPGSYAEFSVRTEVVEATMETTKAMKMVAALAPITRWWLGPPPESSQWPTRAETNRQRAWPRHVKRCTRRPLGCCGPSWSDTSGKRGLPAAERL